MCSCLDAHFNCCIFSLIKKSICLHYYFNYCVVGLLDVLLPYVHYGSYASFRLSFVSGEKGVIFLTKQSCGGKWWKKILIFLEKGM